MQANNLIMLMGIAPSAPQANAKIEAPAPSAGTGSTFSDAMKTAETNDTPANSDPVRPSTELSDEEDDETVSVLAAAVIAPQAFAQTADTSQSANTAAEPLTVTAAQPDSVSVLEGQTNDWSLPLPIDAGQIEARDTARMPNENPAEPTAILPESEPCPPENVNEVPETASPVELSAAEAELSEVAGSLGESRVTRPNPEAADAAVRSDAQSAVVAAPAAAKAETQSDTSSDDGENAEKPAAKTTVSEPLANSSIIGEHIAGAETLRSQIETAAPASPVAREELVPAMIERLEVMTQGTDTTMTLDLKPEFLGKVTMTLVSSESGISVKILADSPEVRSMINTEISGILERMNDRGVKLQSVELAYTGAGSADYTNGSQPQQSGGQSRRSRRQSPAISGISTSTYTSLPIFGYGVAIETLPDGEEYEPLEYTA